MHRLLHLTQANQLHLFHLQRHLQDAQIVMKQRIMGLFVKMGIHCLEQPVYGLYQRLQIMAVILERVLQDLNVL